MREPADDGHRLLPRSEGEEQELTPSEKSTKTRPVNGSWWAPAEVSLDGVPHADEVLDEAALPRLTVAMSPCFRREAGTYGKDTAGLYRIHQFDKVEQVAARLAGQMTWRNPLRLVAPEDPQQRRGDAPGDWNCPTAW